MFPEHPFQKSFCILFMSLVLIFFVIRLRKNEKQGNVSVFPGANTFSSLYDGLFASLNDVGNFSDTNPREIIFDVVKFLKAASAELDYSNNATFYGSRSSGRIYVLGLFDLTSKTGEQTDAVSEFMAAKLAVGHVNALKILARNELVLLVNDTQIVLKKAAEKLPKRQIGRLVRALSRVLVIRSNFTVSSAKFFLQQRTNRAQKCMRLHSKCDPGVAIDRLFHAIYSKHKILMLLGTGCSNVTEALAHIVPYWNIIQISYGARSPVLSDRRQFPLFFRTIAPDSSHNIAKSNFIKHHKWQIVAALSQSENRYLLPINHLVTQLEKENISCISTVTLSHENYREQLMVLKARILGMNGNEYVWILEGSRMIPWWKSRNASCTQQQLLDTTEGVFMVGDYDRSPLVEQNSSELYKLISMNKRAKCSYDAIWAMALAIRASNEDLMHNFDYHRKDIACNFFQLLTKSEFVGLSGPLKFNGADRVGDFIINQMQGGELKEVALYDSLKESLTFNCHTCVPIYWKYGHAPIAQRIVKMTIVTIPTSVVYTVIAISCLGISCSLVFLYFNLKFRHIKSVKLSSPNLNNLTAIGCIFVYTSVILFGFHRMAIIKRYFDEICVVRIYFLSTGFSLTFGSMLAKSYRVHRLFTFTLTPGLKNNLLKDQKLIGLILIPLFIDTITMILWATTDPLKRHLHDLALEISTDDPRTLYQYQVELCQCSNTVGWHVALFAYKSIILIMGVYMAWKTRHIKVQALNDSEYIGICIYSAVFSTILVIAFSFVTEYFVLSFLVKTGSILAAATITLALLSFPKLKSLLSGKAIDSDNGIMESMGLKMQYNTRRFITEDPKELLSRLEIQNKVFRCELESLDREIARLEDLLRECSRTSIISGGHVLNATFSEIHYLDVPRASWPMWQNQAVKTFGSDNKLNNTRTMERECFLGKLKKLFGSITSLHYTYNNFEQRDRRSNPEMCDHIYLHSNKNAGTSYSNIATSQQN